MLILSHYMRFATKNSAKNRKDAIRPMVQILITPKDLAIRSIIGPKDITAA
jgi:hypothetical protein